MSTVPLRVLPDAEVATYAGWFACLSEPTRVRLLHTVATSPEGISVGALTEILGISQSTCSHHVRRLADVGFLKLHKEGTTTRVSVNRACCAEVPHAADAVMGLLAPRPCCPPIVADNAISIRALESEDWPAVRRIYGDGIATGIATFDTTVPTRASLDSAWSPGHRWIAEVDGVIAGWTVLSPVSGRECYSGVAESTVFVGAAHRGRGVGKALIHQQIDAADVDGLWTLQTTVFTANRAGIALHHSAGYRTVGVRERIAQVDGVWHDTVLMERRAG